MTADQSQREILLEEYRQLIESQRDNTRIAYSWMGNIFLFLSGGLFFFGLNTSEGEVFIPSMILGIGLSIIWLALTEVFARYTRERFRRATEIEQKLGMEAFSYGTSQLQRYGRLGWFLQARAYVWLFVVLYVVTWIIALAMKA